MPLMLWYYFDCYSAQSPHTYPCSLLEKCGLKYRKSELTRRRMFFFIQQMYMSPKCVGFPTTAMHFVKLKGIYAHCKYKGTQWLLFCYNCDRPVAPFIESTILCTQIFECLYIHRYLFRVEMAPLKHSKWIGGESF